MTSTEIFGIYVIALLSLVGMVFGLGLSLRWITHFWRENKAATITAIEPIRRRNRWLIGYELTLAVVFAVFYVVTADQRFSAITVVCVLGLCAVVALQLFIKFIYRLKPITTR